MKKLIVAILIGLISAGGVWARRPPLLPESVIAALAEELSGEMAKHHLEYLARLHRIRGSRPFRTAAEYIAGQLQAYGLEDVRIEEFPADGRTFYGTQKARPAWDAEFAELWELRRTGDRWVPHHRLASWEAMPITLAEDSESADVIADLVDVGEGTSESDYAGKDVRGKIVLAAAQPGPVARLAVRRYGAVGIVSYAQNQRTAWWREDENLVRWGHLESLSPISTFAFMTSLKQARAFRRRLSRGETIRLHAIVRAGRHPGFYHVVTAVIPGADPRRKDEEIAYSCHLDHQRPGANDNASGSAAILEVARALMKLIREGKIARPARSLRFIWPPEIEGTLALLNARPRLAARSVPLVPAVREVVERQAARAQQAGVTVSYEAPSDTLDVLAERDGLLQVLDNLLSNAIKFNRRGGTVRISLREAPEGLAAIEISDTGVGIDPAEQERIFERFYRGRSAGRVSGSGIGLATVKAIVERHGGSIRV
ncbi:MAG: M28 family peptidase, partial [Acidobacteria bacterium]